MPVEPILTEDTIARFQRTELIARRVVEGFVNGLHKSPFKGFALDFSHYRDYTRGDELKHLDWNLYGRTDRFYVKQYDEYTVLRAHLVVDASASMNYTSGTVTKFHYARFIAAVLAHILIGQNDSVGLATFGRRVQTYLPPGNTSVHLQQVLQTLGETEPKGETSLVHPLKELAERVKRRGMLVLLSDLFDQPEAITGAITHFARRKHEVVVFRILDEAERTFPFQKFAKFVDLESGAHLFAEPSRIRREYLRRYHELDRTIQQTCHRLAIDYIPVMTSQPPEHAVARYLALRSRSARG